MSKKEEIINFLDGEELLFIDNIDSAIIGYDSEHRIVYDYNLMVEHLVSVDGMTEEEAVEFIDYNIIRSLPYQGDKAPIVLYPIWEI